MISRFKSMESTGEPELMSYIKILDFSLAPPALDILTFKA